VAANGSASQVELWEPALTTRNRFEDALAELLAAWTDDGQVTRDTPRRVMKMLLEMTAGYKLDPAAILATSFQANSDELVALKDIPFSSICEHHLMPFTGLAHVGYLPEDGFVVGISKLARLVDCFALRLQLQERMCQQIAEALIKHVSSRGAAVVIQAGHSCLACRGARKNDATFITSAMLGRFRDNGELRREFFGTLLLRD
jgi:GTP cyclohydrolase I